MLRTTLLIGVLLFSGIAPEIAHGGDLVSVRGYCRKDGVCVRPHVRTAPNHTVTDNLSYRGPSQTSRSQSLPSFSGPSLQPTPQTYVAPVPQVAYEPLPHCKTIPEQFKDWRRNERFVAILARCDAAARAAAR